MRRKISAGHASFWQARMLPISAAKRSRCRAAPDCGPETGALRCVRILIPIWAKRKKTGWTKHDNNALSQPVSLQEKFCLAASKKLRNSAAFFFFLRHSLFRKEAGCSDLKLIKRWCKSWKNKQIQTAGKDFQRNSCFAKRTGQNDDVWMKRWSEKVWTLRDTKRENGQNSGEVFSAKTQAKLWKTALQKGIVLFSCGKNVNSGRKK